MTNTLAALTGVPSLSRPDGSPIYVERCRPELANLARCATCGFLIPEGTFTLSHNVTLHRRSHGRYQNTRVSYWRYL